MKKLICIVLVMCMTLFTLTACSNSGGSGQTDDTKPSAEASGESVDQTVDDLVDDTLEAGGNEEGLSVGFVTFGLGGDFFQQLADAYVEKMTAAGWDAQYADGAFDPQTQIEACENYIAMGVDVLVIWSVAPEAMNAVIDSAMSRGIKVVAFVAPTNEYDVLMVSEDKELADNCARVAAQWIDETFADEEDNSVPVAVLSCRVADTGVVQADQLIQIEQFSKKAKFVIEVECESEDVNTGVQTMENLYVTNPEIKVFLSAHNGLAMGVNNYFTSISSPVTDYSDMGIFTINGDNAVGEQIKASANDESPLRGMVLTGSVNDTAQDIADACIGIMDGTIEKGTVKQAPTTFVTAATADDYIETGKTNLTEDDFK